MEEKLLTPKEAAKLLGVHPLTLYRWAKAGKIKCVVTPSGRYRYPFSEVKRILGLDSKDIDTYHKAVIYVRVPSDKFVKAGIMEKQINELKTFAKKKGFEIKEIIVDISHGFCRKTTGLERLLELAKEGDIKKVLIYSPDALSRVCYWLFEKIFEILGIEIIPLHKTTKEAHEATYLELLDLIVETLQKSQE